MAITLMPLPFSMDALEPAISAETLEFHHGKHHKGYVKKTEELIAGTDLEDQPIEAIVAAARMSNDTALFNQAAQVWNHGFYWASLNPEKSNPSVGLAEAIGEAFGSHDQMIDTLVEAATGQFGSGWAWLIANGDRVLIDTTPNADQPTDSASRPLLVIDVWEHAYYIDRRNDREAYLKAIANIMNWQFASENFDRKATWTYPA